MTELPWFRAWLLGVEVGSRRVGAADVVQKKKKVILENISGEMVLSRLGGGKVWESSRKGLQKLAEERFAKKH